MRIINRLKGSLIVSCQAEEGFPLNTPEHLAALAETAVIGGAKGIRASGPENIRAIREVVKLPIVGIYKKDYPGFSVRITPTLDEVDAIIAAGSDLIALDATKRARPDGMPLEALISRIKREYRIPIMADVSTFEEGMHAASLDVDLISTTLSGYTEYSPKIAGPDLQLVKELAQVLNIPIIAEGRIGTPEDVRAALDAGAYAVVVGSMITRPHLITERFVAATRPRRDTIVQQSQNVLAVDLGGTKIAFGLVHPRGKILEKQVLSTQREAGGAAIINQIIRQIEQMLERHNREGLVAIGVSTGGQVDRSGQIAGGTEMIPDWVGTPLRSILYDRFGFFTTVLNDGHAAAIAEALQGAGRGKSSVLCVVIGTGLGGGLVIDGEIQFGAHGLAGSIGQMKVSPETGLNVPLESIVSGPGLIEAYKLRTGILVSDGKEISHRVAGGDPIGIDVVEAMGNWLGLGLSHALHAYDTQCVIVGGSVAQIGDVLLNAARNSLEKHGHATVAHTPILASRFGSEAGLIGAALYARKCLDDS